MVIMMKKVVKDTRAVLSSLPNSKTGACQRDKCWRAGDRIRTEILGTRHGFSLGFTADVCTSPKNTEVYLSYK